MKDIAILGAGGFAKEVAFLVEDINRALKAPEWRILGYIDAALPERGRRNGKYPVIGDDGYIMNYKGAIHVALGIGTTSIIRKVYEKLKRHGHIHFPNLVHPNVVMDREGVRLGEGNIICAGNVLTTDIVIGSGNLLNISSTYGHDVIIGSYCVFNPGVNISGSVTFGDGCLVGTGATVLQGLTIGTGAVIGAGAVVTRDVAPGVTVTGVPAKPAVRDSSAEIQETS